MSGVKGDTGENNEQRVKTGQSVKTKPWFQRKLGNNPKEKSKHRDKKTHSTC